MARCSPPHWDPGQYARTARFVSDLGAAVLELLEAAPGERILDLGCGDGALTEKLEQAGCRATGVDASAEQVEAARARGLDACVADATRLDFDNEFDAVFSNAALHWVTSPDLAVAGVHRALKPGGRFVAEFGGAGNIAAVCAAIKSALARRGIDFLERNPWYFPTCEDYRARLERHGFDVDVALRVDRPTAIPGDLAEWLELFAQPFFAGLTAADRDGVIADVRESLRGRLQDDRGVWTVDYVRIRVRARKPGSRSTTKATKITNSSNS